MKIFILLLLLLQIQFSFAQAKLPNQANLPGNWMGIDLFQDQETYDGKNYFLPNEEFIVISPEKIKIYFYPFSKSDEFDVLIDEKQIKYQFGKRNIETNYSFTNDQYDTLVFTMHFINKTFVKMYSRVTSINSSKEIDYATIKELDQFGFNPSAITHLFELDTFHRDLFIGFSDYSELDFEPYQFLQFINDNSMSINRKNVVSLKRGYKIMTFEWEGRQEVIQIQHSEGTQSFSIIPTSLCQCDTIVIPYLTVDWADRIRKDMRENSYKYKN